MNVRHMIEFRQHPTLVSTYCFIFCRSDGVCDDRRRRAAGTVPQRIRLYKANPIRVGPMTDSFPVARYCVPYRTEHTTRFNGDPVKGTFECRSLKQTTTISRFQFHSHGRAVRYLIKGQLKRKSRLFPIYSTLPVHKVSTLIPRIYR